MKNDLYSEMSFINYVNVIKKFLVYTQQIFVALEGVFNSAKFLITPFLKNLKS